MTFLLLNRLPEQTTIELRAMKIRSTFLLLALLCWFVQPSVAVEPVDVSLVQLIANPKDHDGQIVRVIGFVRLEFEGNAIYLHQEDYKHGVSKNGLWIDVSDDIRKRRAEYDRKYVLIEGTFSAKDKGHMDMFSGSIQKISRFQLWMQGDEQK
jgi:hypothetical protein